MQTSVICRWINVLNKEKLPDLECGQPVCQERLHTTKPPLRFEVQEMQKFWYSLFHERR
jgi:hypothetical protein